MWLYRRQRPEPVWRRSSFCANGECVEVRLQDGRILLRDSKDRRSKAQHYTMEEWRSFVRGIKAGEFDDLR